MKALILLAALIGLAWQGPDLLRGKLDEDHLLRRIAALEDRVSRLERRG